MIPSDRRSSVDPLLISLTLLVTLPGCVESQTEKMDRVLSHYNRGISSMEQFEPRKAVEEFRQVVKLAPNWVVGQLNLAIALLNTQRDEDLAECQKLLTAVQEAHPKNPYAHYTLGMLFIYRGEMSAARKEFDAAHLLAPKDAHTLYQLGRIAQLERRFEDAEKFFLQAIEQHPGFASAHWGLSRVYLSTNRREEGRRHIQRFQELEAAKTGTKVNVAYTQMGPYADVIRLANLPGFSPRVPSTAGLKFRRLETGLGSDIRPLPDAPEQNTLSLLNGAAAELGPSTTLGDFNGDGITDVFIAAVVAGGDRLLLSSGPGRYIDATSKSGLAADAVSTAGAAGDYDGDGDLDIVVAHTDAALLYRNEGDGTFSNTTAESGIDTGKTLLSTVLFVDADRDGDLDLFLAAYATLTDGPTPTLAPASDRLYVNLGTGSFKDEAVKAGVGSPARSRDAFFSDLDGDGSLDLFVAVDSGPNRYYRNNRALLFEDKTEESGLGDAGPATKAFTADLNGDGFGEVFLLRGPDQPSFLYRNLRHNRFERTLLLPPDGPTAVTGCVGDFDLDGTLDAVLGSNDNLAVLLGDRQGGFLAAEPLPKTEGLRVAPQSLVAEDLDRNGSLEVIVVDHGRTPEVVQSPATEENHWLRVRLKGVHNKEGAFSNSRGVGARVEVKARDRWTIHEVAVGGSEAVPIHVGLGPHKKADYVRIVWPDGILQSEMEVSGNQEVTIGEVQRKSSSCPLLFSWDGKKFRFVTDFLGTGGLGFLLQTNVYAQPDPTEDILIPPGMLVPREGKLLLRILEPMEEVCYLDQIELLAVDHDADTEIYPEERFGGSLASPNGRIVAVGPKTSPKRVSDAQMRDVTAYLMDTDRTWPPVKRDPRFIGFAEEHSLSFDFGSFLPDRSVSLPRGDSGDWFLFLNGWVEYSYSHVNYAAQQAGLRLLPPVLEVPDGRGGWQIVIEDTGYPAGLPRTMVLPLPREVVQTGRFRLRTNMEIYWDRAFIAEDKAATDPEALRVHRLSPVTARLSLYGFPKEYSPDGQLPLLYDYHHKDPGVYFRNIPGDYTRYGDVLEIVSTVDDRHVIFGRGDEVAVEFDSTKLPKLAPRKRRSYILRAFGFCKDRDIYNARPDSVEPLPFREMTSYPYSSKENFPNDEFHQRYREEWNTRRVFDR